MSAHNIAMKDSGIPWIGAIPKSWDVLPIKRVTTCLDGKRVPVDASMRVSGPYPYWGAGNIVDYIDQYLFDEDLVLLGEDGAPFFDKARPVAFHINEKVWVNNHIHVLKAEGIDADYLTYALNAVDYHEYISGSILPKLTQSDMNTITIPIPSHQEQVRISNALNLNCGRIDKVVAGYNEMIVKLNQMKQSIISEVVTKGLNSNVSVKYSGVNWIGDIPESWGLTKVSNQYDVTLGKMLCTSPETPDSTEENYLCSANVKRNGIEGDIKTMWFTPKEKEEYLLKKGDLIVSEGGNAGTPMIYDGSRDPCYIQNAVHRVRAYDNQDIRNRFLYYWMSFAKDIGYVDLVCNKATIAHFTKKKLMEMPVVSIDLDTMSDIVHYLDSKCTQIDLEINYTSGLIDTMSDYKQSLIYEYVTGKKSVDMEAS